MTYKIFIQSQALTSSEQDEVEEVINEIFTFAPWDDEQKLAGKHVVDALKTAAKEIIIHVPPSPSRTRALNCLVDARMLANAAITHKGKY